MLTSQKLQKSPRVKPTDQVACMDVLTFTQLVAYKKKKALLMVDGCVKRHTPEGTLEKESEIKVIIYQDIAGMQISVSASLFRQRFLVCSSSYNIMF